MEIIFIHKIFLYRSGFNLEFLATQSHYGLRVFLPKTFKGYSLLSNETSAASPSTI